jgi:hypothetical protein
MIGSVAGNVEVWLLIIYYVFFWGECPVVPVALLTIRWWGTTYFQVVAGMYSRRRFQRFFES